MPVVLRVSGGLLTAVVALVLTGCGAGQLLNPSFPLTREEAKDYLEERRHDPITLHRPVVVFAGYQDPGFGGQGLARRLRRVVVNPEYVLNMSFFTDRDFDACRDKAIDRVEIAFPSDAETLTTEVDVIGISMGGLVARHSARALEPSSSGTGQDEGLASSERSGPSKRLQIARLFSIATPHRGARLAGLPTFDRKQIDMRSGSVFLEELNKDPTSFDFAIIPYGRLGDSIVGIENSAPDGRGVWWVSNPPFTFSHLMSASDARILADIVRRLAGETPFTVGEPAPPPD